MVPAASILWLLVPIGHRLSRGLQRRTTASLGRSVNSRRSRIDGALLDGQVDTDLASYPVR
jgi:hypothetical protein